MHTVFVRLDVRPEMIDEFISGIEANAHASLHTEPGCLRFDVHRDTADHHRFYFYEIYTDEAAFSVAHRKAPHYASWRETVTRCVVPGSHHNTYAEPVFPNDIAEGPNS
ncbi:putative quinol monooxygenase [Rhodococcoides kyotonense]|uniref:Autoinducer 2-degrading protein n=1 Tax=Rhodococcoides kyotonense TaxID=398843 RepID=A0A239MYR5_9NOCA|nr:putative quinol monooxygenase [Rhodococcus kyotonensis]SNT47322.1 autoinducer 2-degrading protein [Rhodococcus kyotonensis]